jgi:hypothetical protein
MEPDRAAVLRSSNRALRELVENCSAILAANNARKFKTL